VAEQIEVAAPDIPGVPEAPERPHEIQIVPLKGLPVVAILVVMLILSISQNWKWGIAFFPVAGGGIWTAVDLFVGLVIGPILGGLSIPARMEFSARFMPKMVLVMPTVVLLTLAAGLDPRVHHMPEVALTGRVEAVIDEHGQVDADLGCG